MQELSKKSGGLVVLGDAFETRVFKDSFQKIFTKNANGQYSFAFNANIEIHVSDVLYIIDINRIYNGMCWNLLRKF